MSEINAAQGAVQSARLQQEQFEARKKTEARSEPPAVQAQDEVSLSDAAQEIAQAQDTAHQTRVVLEQKPDVTLTSEDKRVDRLV